MKGFLKWIKWIIWIVWILIWIVWKVDMVFNGRIVDIWFSIDGCQLCLEIKDTNVYLRCVKDRNVIFKASLLYCERLVGISFDRYTKLFEDNKILHSTKMQLGRMFTKLVWEMLPQLVKLNHDYVRDVVIYFHFIYLLCGVLQSPIWLSNHNFTLNHLRLKKDEQHVYITCKISQKT